MQENGTAETKRPARIAWAKRHQVAVAIIGAVLATTSYFGKDLAQEHWKTLGANIKAAEDNDDAVQSTSRLNERLIRLSDELSVLTEDALAFERNQKPHAQSDRFDSTQQASATSRNTSLVLQLQKSQVRLTALLALNEATDAHSEYTGRLKQLRSDTDRELATAQREQIADITSNVELFGDSPRNAPDQIEKRSNALFRRERTSDRIEQSVEELGAKLRESADARRETYKRYEESTKVALSIVFVLGLLLSLAGKLTGAGEESGGGE